VNYNILIIGNGFIGKNLYNSYSGLCQTRITNKEELDVRSGESIRNFFLGPDVYTHIIYAAGLKDVGYCERKPDEAYAINGDAIKKILKVVNPEKFIYISTDYVFDGEKGFYSETDAPNPKTIYGQSKLLGEWYTKAYANNHMIVRASGVYGNNCGWLEWLLAEARANSEVICFSDVYNSPTCVNNLAEMIMDMIEKDYSGTINLCGPQVVNRYELYKSVFDYYEGNSEKLFRGSGIKKFPKNVSLDPSLYKELSKKRPATINDGLRFLKEGERNEN